MDTMTTNNLPQVQASQAVPMPTGINFFDPSTFDTLTKLSTMLATSSLVPDCYRINGVVGGRAGEGPKKTVSREEAIANCLIAFDVASRIGASPLMVMQNLYIVHGKPSWSAKFLIATINTCGRFEPLKFVMLSQGQASNGVKNVKCFAWTTPKGVTRNPDGTPVTHESTHAIVGTKITIQMALDEGWYNKPGSKWKTIPEQMLRYRAASFWCSTYAPEISMGMRTVEEAIEEADAVEITDQVQQEIAANANAQTISFADTPADANPIIDIAADAPVEAAPEAAPAEAAQPENNVPEDPGY